MEKLKFAKMHGAGNNFIIFEDFENKYENLEAVAKILCDRAFGIGADGILVIRKSTVAEIQMIIINADGSYAAMCGNGIRCFAKYVYDKGLVKNTSLDIETGDGVKHAKLEIENNKVIGVTINMGIPTFEPARVPVASEDIVLNKNISIGENRYTITSMLLGVPHTIIIDPIDKYPVEEGRLIEKSSIFPQGTNVNFCEVINKDEITVKTWERGAGATLACGTGSCASVVACHKLKLVNSKVKVNIPGGSLVVEITEEGVMMTGPAVTVFEGETLELDF
jgi:diaminopimelate epimerase